MTQGKFGLPFTNCCNCHCEQRTMVRFVFFL